MNHLKQIMDLCEESRYAVAYQTLDEKHIRMNEIYDLAQKALEEENKALDWLQCLENAGVDNWQGCDHAAELMKEKYGDDW